VFTIVGLDRGTGGRLALAAEEEKTGRIVQPVYGTTYTSSSKKNAEHGGFSYGDTNVGLIVSNPAFSSTVLKTPVSTSQVAPSILHALGINPRALKSVQIEKTDLLPALP